MANEGNTGLDGKSPCINCGHYWEDLKTCRLHIIFIPKERCTDYFYSPIKPDDCYREMG
jgi:hypothetical protein